MTSLPIQIDEKDVLDPKDLEELYSWIDGAPLSRPKKNIARDFSDGVSVAEIVHFYMPRTVELHNYVNANSTAQKRINWNMLNRKVFVKLNLKLTEKTLDNVIESKPGAIEQVLWDLKKKIIELNPKTLTRRSSTSNQLQAKNPSGYADTKVSKKVPSGNVANALPTRVPVKSSHSPGPGKAKTTTLIAPLVAIKGSEKHPDTSSYAAGLQDELTVFENNLNYNNANPDTATVEVGQTLDTNANINQGDSSSLPPAYLIYKGHKMVPAILVEIKNRQIRDLEVISNGLQKKVNFLDNLIQVKDNRVEDLTRQLHTLKSKFQQFTQANIAEL